MNSIQKKSKKCIIAFLVFSMWFGMQMTVSIKALSPDFSEYAYQPDIQKALQDGTMSVADPDDFTFDATTGTITDFPNIHHYFSPQQPLIFPSQIHGVDVLAIKGTRVSTVNGSSPYSMVSEKGIVLPNTVQELDDFAFDSYKGSEFIFPPSMKKIKDGSFRYAGDLKKVIIPDSVTEIGAGAFQNDTSLKSLKLSNNLETLGKWAFLRTGIQSLTIPKSLRNIGLEAFQSCENLTSVTAEEGLETIGEGMFYGCFSINSVTLPNSLKTIEKEAFFGNTRLASITIPQGVTIIGKGAFKNNGLKDLQILSNGSLRINKNAFSNNALESIVLPAGVEQIDDNCFQSNRLKQVTFLGNTPPPTLGVNIFNNNIQLDETKPEILIGVPSGFENDYMTVFTDKLPTDDLFSKARIVKTIRIQYHTNGGNTMADGYGSANCVIQTPTAPTKNGYGFQGWYKDTGLTQKWDFGNDTSINDITLYAKWQKVYTVAFQTNGGAPIDSLIVNEHQLLTKPTMSDRTGYVLKGWYSDQTLTHKWDFNLDQVISDMTLYAKWQKVYTVAFQTNGGAPIDSLVVDDHQLLTKPTMSDRPNYEFQGWYRDNTFAQEWDFNSDEVTSDMTLYAKWQKVYTVAFQTNGATPIDSVVVNDHQLLTKPTMSDRTGYVLKGWYSDQTLTHKWDFNLDQVISDMTLYAKWQKVHTVAFQTNGATPIDSIVVNDHQLLTKPTMSDRTGYVFKGWYSDDAFTHKWDFNSDEVTSDMTLYAKWQKVHTVAFQTNGATPIDSIVVNDHQLLTKPTMSDRTGYVLKGWYSDQALTHKWDFNSDEVTSDITLYAKWQKIYTVSFQTNGATPIDSIVVNDHQLLTKPTMSDRTGYVLKGWYSDQTLTHKWDFNSDEVTSDITLYAKWQKVYTVAFQTNGATLIDSIVVNDHQLLTKPTMSDRIGYVFKGWYSDQTLTHKWDFNLDEVTSDITLYAKWQKVYTVAFQTNGATPIDSIVVNDHQLLTKPTMSDRTGYVFKGWYQDQADSLKWDFDTDKITSDITLYAKWNPLYTVSFHDEAGNLISKQSIEMGEDAKDPQYQAPYGYRFVKWDMEYQQVNKDLTISPILEKITVPDKDTTIDSNEKKDKVTTEKQDKVTTGIQEPIQLLTLYVVGSLLIMVYMKNKFVS